MSTHCTGIAAVWCPVHGDCDCPRDHEGIRDLQSDECPLHGWASDHAERAEDAVPETFPDLPDQTLIDALHARGYAVTAAGAGPTLVKSIVDTSGAPKSQPENANDCATLAAEPVEVSSDEP